MANLALFDFDGTITTQDTFVPFILFSTSKTRFFLSLLAIFPFITLYKLKLFSTTNMRQVVTFFAFYGRAVNNINTLAEHYVKHQITNKIRPEAIEKLNWHKARKDKIVVVSASLDIYLSIWCKNNGLELICSELAVNKNKLTGRYKNGDCCGENKVRFINKTVKLNRFNKIYAYGDTTEDLPMLDLADEKYYQWQKLVS